MKRAAVSEALAMIVAGGTFQWWWPNRAVLLSAELVDFPTTIGRWESLPDTSLAESLNALDFDKKLVRGYATADGEEVNLLWVPVNAGAGQGLAGQSMLGGTGLSGFWTAPDTSARGAVMNELIASKGGERFYVVYAPRRVVIASDIDAKVHTTWNVLTERRSNGGVMLVAGKIRSSEDIGAARQRVRRLRGRGDAPIGGAHLWSAVSVGVCNCDDVPSAF